MLGQRIQHPLSTNFDEGERFPNPCTKRLKRFASTDSSLSRKQSEDEDGAITPFCRSSSREIPDSETEDDEGEGVPDPGCETALESASPCMKTDEAAIANYEATRAADGEILDLHGRLGQRRWVPGKSSIYVDAFNLALETVLEDESHLFDEAEMAVFEKWRSLSYEGQYL
jgi:Fanconi-associated nuclease 1